MGALLCVATVAGFLGGWWWPFDLFSHFRVQYAWALALTAVALLYPKRFRYATVFACFTGLNLAMIMPLYLNDTASIPESPSPAIRAVLFNVNSGTGDPDKVMALLRECDPDIIVLEEMSARWVDGMSDLPEGYSHATIEAREDNFGIGFFSRLPVEKAEVMYIGEAGVPSIVVTLRVDETSLTVIATHPLPPVGSRYTRLRNGQLEALAQHARQTEGPLLLLGDLNATPWSYPFRRLLKDSGLRDSLRGFGVQTTWPTFNPFLRIPIDHCLFSDGVQILNRERGRRAGSDHFPVIIDFSMAPVPLARRPLSLLQ